MSDDLLETRSSVSGSAAETLGSFAALDAPSALPSRIGQYRILRLLGEGGMGAVYEAEQDQPRRLIALKVIRAGWASPDLIRRFQQESQALGRLQHPGIAQIYEAGAAETPFGVQPYFAMELIKGKPLVEYAEEHKLNTRQRLELMIAVCEAVEHAHQRGIIHRDLKPGNILVDETGQPKILDFGLARATDSDAQATRQTDMGQLLGTLAYMSPEQVLADPLALDTRSDVYALGVILYELLARKMPYALSNRLHEAVQTIRLTEPQKLSSVDRSYRGDIETIVAKALDKDKERRYPSAAALAGDIGRYLRDEPIVARPPSTVYQLQKFARRNKALVTGIAAVIVVLVLGVVASTWEAVRARRAQKEAQQQTAISQAVNDFLQKDLFGQASAYNQAKPDPNLTVRTALDRAAKNIQGKFAGQPAVEAAIRQTIGKTYGDIGLYPQEREQMQKAFDLSRRALGMDDSRTLSILEGLGVAEQDVGHLAQAEAFDRQALDRSRRVLGPDNPITLEVMQDLFADYSAEAKFAQADPLGQQALIISRKTLGPENRTTLGLMFTTAVNKSSEGNYAQAEALLQQVMDTQQRVLGGEHPDTLESMTRLAFIFDYEGKYAQAEALSRQAVGTQQRVFGPDAPDTLASMNGLAWAYRGEGEYARAEALDRKILAVRHRVLGPEHPDTLISANNLANDLKLQRKYAEAEALDEQTLAVRRRVLGPEHPDTLMSMNNLAYGLLTAKNHSYRRPEEALDLARRAAKLCRDKGYILNTLGLAEVRNRKWDEAIATLDKSMKANNGSDPTDFMFLAMAYHGRGDNVDAEKNYARGAEMASKQAVNDPELMMLWRETAAALGKPSPKSPPAGSVAAVR